ncbi:hypothetical protein [Lacrimispora celerecrescens]|uniref:hypothetical protein n=1 Tax=Lacrimispora celerecrescens TaxID=29354 RepID=UPI001FA8DABA|nr:hypothetical protein [Lacrimispora celerecrescens]
MKRKPVRQIPMGMQAVQDELLVAAAYDGDGNRLFQLNYNLHTDDDWKGNSGNGNGNNKDNTGSRNNGNSGISGVISEALSSVVDFFTGSAVETATEPETEAKSNGNKNKDKGNDGNATNNGKGNGNGKDNSSGNNGNNGNNGNGNTNNTGGSQNQSGILMPQKPISDVEQGLIDLIKTTGKHKNYELIEYVNDVNRDYTEVLMEVNIDGEMDTAYTYGNERLALRAFHRLLYQRSQRKRHRSNRQRGNLMEVLPLQPYRRYYLWKAAV